MTQPLNQPTIGKTASSPAYRKGRSRWSLVLAGIVALALAVPEGQTAAPKLVNCDRLPHWSNFASGPQVNQPHIFCGEFSNGRPKGFHSRPGGTNPRTVARFQVTQPPNRRGIYGVRWSHGADPSREKFSTMFPDRCSQAQVLESIRYAARNQISCPGGAPDWAWCGYNRPGNRSTSAQAAVAPVAQLMPAAPGATALALPQDPSAAEDSPIAPASRFCEANDGQRFVIAGAFVRGRNQINTAFPLR